MSVDKYISVKVKASDSRSVEPSIAVSEADCLARGPFFSNFLKSVPRDWPVGNLSTFFFRGQKKLGCCSFFFKYGC